MVHSSLVALLLSFELVAQAPSSPQSWVEVRSKEGDFSFSAPANPKVGSREVSTPGGKLKIKSYTVDERGDRYNVQHVALPEPLAPNMIESQLAVFKNTPIANMPPLVADKRISVGDVAGLELIYRGSMPGVKGVTSVKVHLFMNVSSRYILGVRSAPDRPLPAQTDRFLESIRFGGQLAESPKSIAGSPAGAVKRKAMGKIDLVNKTPEDALRTFLMAMMAADEQTLRVVALPNPELDLLLTGNPPPFRGVKEVKEGILKMQIERLKVGDQVRLPGNKVHVTRAGEVGRDRAVLLPEDAPVPTRLRLVDGHWKVDASTYIAARKAADASRKKARAS